MTGEIKISGSTWKAIVTELSYEDAKKYFE